MIASLIMSTQKNRQLQDYMLRRAIQGGLGRCDHGGSASMFTLVARAGWGRAGALFGRSGSSFLGGHCESERSRKKGGKPKNARIETVNGREMCSKWCWGLNAACERESKASRRASEPGGVELIYSRRIHCGSILSPTLDASTLGSIQSISQQQHMNRRFLGFPFSHRRVVWCWAYCTVALQSPVPGHGTVSLSASPPWNPHHIITLPSITSEPGFRTQLARMTNVLAGRHSAVRHVCTPQVPVL
nr:hypothetical protein CFP56_38815 [Quercus suber]